MAGYKAGMAGLLLACAGCYAVPAAAQVHADVTVSNLRYVLTDLTPDDGQAPSFSFGNADLGPMSLSSFVTPQASEQNAYNFVQRTGDFVFSPHTTLSLLLDVHISMSAPPVYTPGQSGTAWAGFVMNTEWGPSKGRVDLRDSDEDDGSVGDVFGGYQSGVDRVRTLALTIPNDSDYAASGDFLIDLEATAHALASPVPEAPASAMLALGIGVLGVVRRRRLLVKPDPLNKNPHQQNR